MRNIYNINPDIDMPIYQQLTDCICTAIKKGILPLGEQLPTVQEMTYELGIARGTVKRAYDELERLNMVEKIQGRGTFVCYQAADVNSRKEQAMAAIEAMLLQLEDMGFSAGEINIFLSLKLREYLEKEENVKIALVECNTENLSHISEQIRSISGVDLFSFTLDSVKEYPYKLNQDFDFVVTTQLHAQYLESIVADKNQIIHVALHFPSRCLSGIIKLHPGMRVGVIGYSQKFADLLYDLCQTYAEGVVLSEPLVAVSEEQVSQYLMDKDAILVPKGYERFFGEVTSEFICGFGGSIIECNYKMDEGSILYLKSKIRKVLEDKQCKC